MSFSYRTKSELCRISTDKKDVMVAELAGIIHSSGIIQISGLGKYSLKLSTENAPLARKIFALIKKLYNINAEIAVRKNIRLRKNNNYLLIVPSSKDTKQILLDTHSISTDHEGNVDLYRGIHRQLVHNRDFKMAYLRGAFLGSGSMSDPEKMYHLEFVTHRKYYGQELCALINSLGLQSKTIERKNTYVVYMKEGEHIVTLLNMMGAHSALLDFENIRVYKDVRNNINRIVNCETANLAKTINASMRQIENIKYIDEVLGYKNLSPSLREIAQYRLHYPDASLRELGELLDPPIGKSGVNHRLRKLEKLAKDLREEKGEV
ncbi:MAG: DNA-binding protein WhiA [Clostridiales bacterium]|nr:DNA-binding protein WhiA [Clostridiales bacterium]